jgi:Tol biopolymer transport system component
LPLDGSPEIKIVKHDADDTFPIWVPGRNIIVFISDRNGSKGLWSLKMQGGSPVGKPILLRGELEASFNLLGITNNGIIYNAISTARSDIFLSSIDFESGKVLKAPEKISIDNQGKNIKPKWSPDGEKLAFFELHEGSDPNKKPHVKFVVKDKKTGTSQIINTNLVGWVRNYWFDYQWFPDCQSILTMGIDEKQQCGLFRVNIVTGTTTPFLVKQNVPNQDRTYGYFPQFSPDGNLLYFESTDNKSIICRNISSGIEKPVCQLDDQLNQFLLSPKGEMIVFAYSFNNTNNLYMLPSSGGEIKKIATFPDKKNINLISWSPDNKKVYFIFGGELSEGPVYSTLIEDGKTTITITSEELKALKGIRRMSVNPDGKTVALSMITGKGLEIWAMENFLPKK